MTTRKYSSRAQQTTLSSGISSVDSTMTVGSGANLMGGKTPAVGETYTVVIDPDTALEEIVDVSNYASGNTLTIARGIDGSTGVAHSAGAVIRHMVIGRDLQDANTHIENTTTAHGITLANLIKTTDTGTVTSTMITDGTILNADINASAGIVDTKLATISTASKVSNSATTAASANTASAIVARDASGNFTAGTITAALTGNVTGNLTGTASAATLAATATALATGRTISLTGDVSGTSASFDGTGNASITAAIAANIIVDADINASAAITATKIAGTAVTQADTGTVTSTMILDGTILNADINSAAAIDKTKISGTAVTVTDTGTVTSTMIADGTIVNADINASAAIALSKLASDPLARANHTGTQLAATISDFDTQVRTSRLDQMAAPTASVALNAQKITGLADPTLAQDASTKAYTDLQITNLIAAAPGALDTLDELAAALGDDASFATTVTNSIAAKLPLAGGTMSGAIAMGTSKITGLGTPTVSTDAATKAYADTMLPLVGGTLSGAIAMGTNKITGLGTPTVSTDASTKAYADTMLPLAGGTMSGAIAMGTSKITGVGDPTNAQDVVTKYYLDNVVLAPSNLTGPITSVGAATSIASQTGTGTKFVVDTSPTIVTPTLSGATVAGTINGTTIPSSKTLVATDSTQYVVPSQTGNSGKFLTTDGTTSSWGTVAGYSTPTLGSTSIPSGATVTTITGLTLTSPTISTITNTGTVTLPTATDTLVGRATTDTLTNKTLTSPVIATIVNSGTLTLPTTTGTVALTSDITVTASSTTTLTNKTVSLTSNTVSGTLAEFNSALSGDDFVSLTGSETLTNKTLTTPVITNPKITLTYSAKTAAYTAVTGDEGGVFSMNNASTTQFNIPTDATFNFAIGTQFNVFWITGAGQPTIGAVTPGTTTVISTGATSATPKLRVANSMATCLKIAANSWIVIGDIS